MRKMILVLAAAMLAPVIWADEPPHPPPPGENQKAQGGERVNQRRQRQMRDFFASLSEKERKELRELQESKPEEAKKVMAERLEKYNQEVRKREKYLQDQIRVYQTSQAKEERDKAYAEIKRITVEDFERNMKEHKHLVEFLEKRSKSERERYDGRMKNADAIIQARIEELTKPTELRW